MGHPLDHAVASELSYLVLQKRRERGELSPCALDSSNQTLYALPSRMVQTSSAVRQRRLRGAREATAAVLVGVCAA